MREYETSGKRVNLFLRAFEDCRRARDPAHFSAGETIPSRAVVDAREGCQMALLRIDLREGGNYVDIVVLERRGHARATKAGGIIGNAVIAQADDGA